LQEILKKMATWKVMLKNNIKIAFIEMGREKCTAFILHKIGTSVGSLEHGNEFYTKKYKFTRCYYFND
jgi:hypothetical protein